MTDSGGVRFRGSRRGIRQTVTGDLEFKNERIDRERLPNYAAYVLILTFAVLMQLFSLLPNFLPKQVTLTEEHSQPERFIGQRAESFLRRLTDIGTRVVGSYENEVLALDLLQREISFITQQTEPVHKIETDIQKPTGSYYLQFKPYEFRNYYANIQNLVVKFTGSNSSSDSVLLNCHYDTVPESPGASDNGLNCAVLLEVLTKLSKLKTPLRNTVIFLFNGAEESPLQASHGFITQHKWSKNVKAVINLDAGGAGGREMVFQTTASVPWIAKTYAEVAWHPSGNVAGEELFQSGIIPSDTDFRIFRDFGKVPGLDMAHVYNGYVYHTRYDTMNFIPSGTIQHTGDNVLALTKKFASSPELGTLHVPKEGPIWGIVYFDVFGLFMVVYTEITAIVINVIAAIISLYTVYNTFALFSGSSKPWKKLAKSTAIQLMSWSLSTALLFLIAKTVDLSKATLSWYSHPGYIIILYVFPLIFASSVLPMLFLLYKKGITPHEMAISCMNGSQLLWTIVLLIGTCLRVRSTYFVLPMVLTSAVASAIATYSRDSFSAKRYIIWNFALTISPVIFIVNQGVSLFSVLIPMTGRMGPQSQPELIIAMLTAVVGIIATSYLTPLILILRKPKVVLIVLCVTHVLGIVTAMYTPLGFPYNSDPSFPTLQRINVIHTERTFHDSKGNVRKSDSGFFVQSLDRNNVNYVSKVVDKLRTARSSAPECATELGCGTPVYTSRFLKPAAYSHWVDAYAPLVHHPTNLVLTSQTPLDIRTRKMSFAVTGPDHMTMFISPRAGVNLKKWSFDDGQPKIIDKWGERDLYMVYYCHGLMGGTLEFDLHLEVNQNVTASNPVVDVAAIGHYMHMKSSRTKEFTDFLSEFPDWVHLTPWTATYKSWAF